MSEKQLRDSIVQALNMMGYWVWAVNTGAMKIDKRFVRFNQAGTSDIIGMRNADGKFVAIEVKLPGKEKTLTFYQRSFLEMVKLNGGIAFVATGIEDVKRNLNIGNV